ncbi:MAG: hypothetical protein J0H78_12945 [Rhizobiales bacterium]|nr:hypothetical protein [Hyphomicrobiales bacterium]OJY43445.1 MAG: hypothetical protein BGP08_01290 [Rhizobiales bacterium 64-17]
MEKKVRLPEPTEDKLTNLIIREVPLPNGRILKLQMSEWHWEMLAFEEVWNDVYGREYGLIYEFYKMAPNTKDRVLSDAMMSVLRDDYNEYLAKFAPGEEPEYDDPRQ